MVPALLSIRYRLVLPIVVFADLVHGGRVFPPLALLTLFVVRALALRLLLATSRPCASYRSSGVRHDLREARRGHLSGPRELAEEARFGSFSANSGQRAHEDSWGTVHRKMEKLGLLIGCFGCFD